MRCDRDVTYLYDFALPLPVLIPSQFNTDPAQRDTKIDISNENINNVNLSYNWLHYSPPKTYSSLSE